MDDRDSISWSLSGKIFFAVSIVAMVLGVVAGEPETIHAIATMICTKCIGLG
ncbi:MAG: hypothetical protein HQM10_15070 [Candidatus Riflebacteria bacterium]|nr:hypothetical protein [Candidatus Riflebacteria bacterium]